MLYTHSYKLCSWFCCCWHASTTFLGGNFTPLDACICLGQLVELAWSVNRLLSKTTLKTESAWETSTWSELSLFLKIFYTFSVAVFAIKMQFKLYRITKD